MKELFNKYKNDFKLFFLEVKNKDTRKKQIANILTMSRLLAPIVILPAMFTGHLYLSFAMMSLFALTDAFDGYFARKYNAVSNFGKDLDAFTDKIFAITLIVPMIMTQPLVWINLLFETIISSIIIYSKYKNNEPRTIKIGKIKTISLSLAIILSYLSLLVPINSLVINFSLITTSILQLITSYEYINIHRKKENLKKSKIENKDIKISDADNNTNPDLTKQELLNLQVKIKNIKMKQQILKTAIQEQNLVEEVEINQTEKTKVKKMWFASHFNFS